MCYEEGGRRVSSLGLPPPWSWLSAFSPSDLATLVLALEDDIGAALARKSSRRSRSLLGVSLPPFALRLFCLPPFISFGFPTLLFFSWVFCFCFYFCLCFPCLVVYLVVAYLLEGRHERENQNFFLPWMYFILWTFLSWMSSRQRQGRALEFPSWVLLGLGRISCLVQVAL